jgi:hypothetical protein
VPSLDRFIYEESETYVEDGVFYDDFGALGGTYSSPNKISFNATLYIYSGAPTLFAGAKGVDCVHHVVGHELGHENVVIEYVSQRRTIYDAYLVELGNNPHPVGSPAFDEYVSQAQADLYAAWDAMDEDGDEVPDDIDPDGLDDDHEQLAETYAATRPYDVSVQDEWSEGGKNDT